MTCSCKEGVAVSYEIKVYSSNTTVEHRNATSIYFINKSSLTAYVNEIPLFAGSEKLDVFKNQNGEKIVTNFQLRFSTTEESANVMVVIWEFKNNVTGSGNIKC